MAATVGGGGARGPHVFVVRPPPPSRYRRQTLIKYNRMVSAPASSTPSRCPSTRQEMSKARNNLAARLQENWLRKHPDDKASHEVDDSLTSLGWLQNLSIMKLSTPTPPASPNNQATVAGAHVSPNAAMSGSRPLSPNFLNQSLCDPPGVNPNSILNMSHLTTSQSVPNTPSLMKQECRSIPSPPHRGVGDGFEGCDFPPGGVGEESGGELPDYCINPCIKPPFSYATLICMAMRDSRRQKITLAGIYKWITDNFIYYRVADPSWQNSIRHNLSLNKCFQKVARRKDEPGGKGGFWKINPQYSDTLVNGILTRRRGSGAGGTSSASTKDTLNAFGYLANTTTNSNSNPLLNGMVNLDGPPLKKIKREALDLDGLTESDFMNDAFNDVHDDDDDDDDEDMDDGDTCSTTGYSTDVAPSGYVSRAETANAVFHLTTGDGHDDDDIINNTLSTSDFSWSALMNRDIDIGGVNVKTEDLIDHELSAIDAPPPHLTVNDLSTQADDNVSNHVTGRVTKKSDTPGDATPITDMSPPPSEDNSDLGVDDLLFNMSPGDVNSSDLDGVSGTPALDFLSGDPLDLTISGTGLNKPSWWVEGVNELLKSPTRTGDGGGSSSRINTPVMQSPDHHPWAECKSYLDDAISSFDVDFKDFFDLEDKADTGSAS